jgi:hypothetical protein
MILLDALVNLCIIVLAGYIIHRYIDKRKDSE